MKPARTYPDPGYRWRIAHRLPSDSHWTLFDEMQGRYSYEKEEHARARCEAFKNSPTCRALYAPGTIFEALLWPCWPGHLDPVGCYLPVTP